MIQDEFKLRPRYGEVDQMGYVYHANYVSYCHQARTELLRKFDIHDHNLEENNVMLPVIDFNIQYKKPSFYDEQLTIITTIKEMPKVRFRFEFDIRNAQGELVSKASSTVVFVNKTTRIPIPMPTFIAQKLESAFSLINEMNH